MSENEVMPNSFSTLYQPSDIAREVLRLGTAIDKWAGEVWLNSHTDVLAIPILRGGLFFLADLVRNISHSVEIAPTRAWGYEKNQPKSNSTHVNVNDVPAKGRSLLLVDDICDSGKTLLSLTQALMRNGAREVKAAVLIKRDIEGQAYNPEWVGFDYSGPEWIVGYGMDDCDRWRNLPGIYVIKQSPKKLEKV